MADSPTPCKTGRFVSECSPASASGSDYQPTPEKKRKVPRASTASTTANARPTLPVEEPDWIKLIDFPLGFEFKILNDDRTVLTFALRVNKRTSLIDAYAEKKPGVKTRQGQQDLKGARAISWLGKAPTGQIKGQHGNSTKLPPAKSLEYFVCQHTDVNRGSRENRSRQTHIEAEPCHFSFAVRD